MHLPHAALELLVFLAVFGALLLVSKLLWNDGLWSTFLALTTALMAEQIVGQWLRRDRG